MSRQPGNFRQFLREAARRIAAADPDMPAEKREAFAQHAMWVQWRDMFGDDRVRLRAPKMDPTAREARAQRIEHALLVGESVSMVARRENLDYNTVHERAARLRGRPITRK